MVPFPVFFGSLYCSLTYIKSVGSVRNFGVLGVLRTRRGLRCTGLVTPTVMSRTTAISLRGDVQLRVIVVAHDTTTGVLHRPRTR